VYLVVFLSPIEAMFAFIVMMGLSVLHLYNIRKVTVLNRHSKEVLSHCPEVGGAVLILEGVKFELKEN
jgi:hypothetical protein